MSGSSGGADRRRRLLALVPLGVLVLAACSVPREADLAAGGTAGGVPSPAVTSSGPPPAPVVAAGSISSAPSPSASPTPSSTPSPTFAPVKPPVLKAVKGYTLSAAPRSVPNPLAGVKGANDLFGATTVRAVSTKGTPVGLTFLFAVRPQYLDDTQITGAVFSRLAASITRSGVPLEEVRWGRRTVCVGSSAKNGTIAVWYTKGVLTVVVGGADPAVVTAYAKALAAVS